MQDCAPVTAQPPVGPQGEPAADFAVEPVTLFVRHGDVTRERVEQVDVALGVINDLPVEVTDLTVSEQPTLSDFGAAVWQLIRRGPTRVGGKTLVNLLIDFLDLAKERITVIRERMLGVPESQMPIRRQQTAGFAVADVGVEPAPCSGSENQLEGMLFLGLPILKRCLDDLHVGVSGKIVSRRGGQVLSELKANEPETSSGQGQGGLARRAADLQQTIAGV